MIRARIAFLNSYAGLRLCQKLLRCSNYPVQKTGLQLVYLVMLDISRPLTLNLTNTILIILE